jgi:hypothetical protein
VVAFDPARRNAAVERNIVNYFNSLTDSGRSRFAASQQFRSPAKYRGAP